MVLTCDIGTSSLKLGIIDRAGALRSYARLPVARPSAAAWWGAFRRAALLVPAAMRRSVRAVGVSGNAPTLIPVDRRGLPVSGPLMWDDPDGEPTAGGSSLSYFLPKVARFALKYPRQYDRTACFLPSGEYLAFVLTGNKSAFIPHSGFEPYYWLAEDITRFRLDREKFPALTRIGTPVGEVTALASRLTGLPAGKPVFGGGADFLMAILGSGTIKPGKANDRGGTSEALNYCSVQEVSSPLLRAVPGLAPGTWNLGGFVPNVGRLQSRLKDALVGRRRSFEDFSALADAAAPGANGLRFRPLAGGFDVRRRLPLAAAFSGISDRTAREEYVEAFFEYMCFALRRIIEDLEKNGFELLAIHCSGGLSKNTRLNRLKATVTGKTVKIPEVEDSELLGNALVAFVGAGDFGSIENASLELVRYRTECEPDRSKKAIFDDLYRQFLQTAQAGETRKGGGYSIEAHD